MGTFNSVGQFTAGFNSNIYKYRLNQGDTLIRNIINVSGQAIGAGGNIQSALLSQYGFNSLVFYININTTIGTPSYQFALMGQWGNADIVSCGNSGLNTTTGNAFHSLIIVPGSGATLLTQPTGINGNVISLGHGIMAPNFALRITSTNAVTIDCVVHAWLKGI